MFCGWLHHRPKSFADPCVESPLTPEGLSKWVEIPTNFHEQFARTSPERISTPGIYFVIMESISEPFAITASRCAAANTRAFTGILKLLPHRLHRLIRSNLRAVAH